MKNRGKSMKPWARWAGLGAVFFVFVGLIWWASYEADFLRKQKLEPRLIHAPGSPVKVRPEDAGGMAFPNRNRKVDDLLSQDGVSEDVALAESSVPPVSSLEGVEKSTEGETVEKAAPPKPLPKPEPKPEPKMVKKEIVKPKPAPVVVKPASKPAGAWGVQVGSFTTKADAAKAIDTYNGRYGDLLSVVEGKVSRADLGAKGVRYRVQFVGATTKQAATNLCAALKKRGQGCFPVKP